MRKAQADEIMGTNAHQTNSWLLGGDFCSASLAAWIGAKLCSEAACEYLRVIEGYGACVCVRAPRGGLKTSARAREFYYASASVWVVQMSIQPTDRVMGVKDPLASI